MKKLFNDFKDFIMQGSVVDLAIGVIIGAAFGALVNSLVGNILMPPVGLLLGNVDFKDLFVVLKQGEQALPVGATLEMARDAGAVTLNYGQFITDIISFLILGLTIFFIVKAIKSLEEKALKAETEKEEAPTEKDCPFCSKSIPLAATRCPYCTSHLEVLSGANE